MKRLIGVAAGLAVVYVGLKAQALNCVSSHDRTWDNGQFGQALRGAIFNMNWAGGSVGDLVPEIQNPPNRGGSVWVFALP